MRITIRIYKRHDVDLLAIKHALGRKMPALVKNAIYSYLSGNDNKISYPKIAWSSLDDMPTYYLIQLSLNPSNPDEQLICDFIKSIPPGFRNSILKHITRYYIAPVKCIKFSRKNKIYLSERN